MKVLVLDCGGTITQEPVAGGSLAPSSKSLLDHVPGLAGAARVDVRPLPRKDSTETTTADRVRMARVIYDNHRDYDGFVLAHGTDTMVDTAAALTYMLQGLGKPVILTGAQRPISFPASDGPGNLYNAVTLATMDLGEVAICFGDRVVRGVAAIKENGFLYNAFASHQVPRIGDLGVGAKLHPHRICRCESEPVLFTDVDTNVVIVNQNSGSDVNMLELVRERVSGVVVGGFGAGNVQTRYHEHIRWMVDHGKPVVVTTVCLTGEADMTLYQVGSGAQSAGACPAGNITSQAALQKLMYALGRCRAERGGVDVGHVYELVRTPVAGDVC